MSLLAVVRPATPMEMLYPIANDSNQPENPPVILQAVFFARHPIRLSRERRNPCGSAYLMIYEIQRVARPNSLGRGGNYVPGRRLVCREERGDRRNLLPRPQEVASGLGRDAVEGVT